MSGTDDAATPSLIEWAGGSPAITRLIDAFYDRVEQDDLLSPFFPGGVSLEHRRHLSLWSTELLGGPSDYTDRLGGYERMLLITARPGDHRSPAAAFRHDDEPGRGRRRPPRGSGVPRGPRQLPGVGDPAGDGQLAAGGHAR